MIQNHGVTGQSGPSYGFPAWRFASVSKTTRVPITKRLSEQMESYVNRLRKEKPGMSALQASSTFLLSSGSGTGVLAVSKTPVRE